MRSFYLKIQYYSKIIDNILIPIIKENNYYFGEKIQYEIILPHEL